MGAGLSHLQLFSGAMVAATFSDGAAPDASHAGGAGAGATAVFAQHDFGSSGSSTAAQQLGLTFGLGFGAGASGLGLVQQHADAARSTGEHAQVAVEHAVAVMTAVSLVAVATGNATAGVNWPNRARTASAVRNVPDDRVRKRITTMRVYGEDKFPFAPRQARRCANPRPTKDLPRAV